MNTAYRIFLYGGPDDGDKLTAGKPYHTVTTNNGHVYKAELDEEEKPIIEDWDKEEGVSIECITPDGIVEVEVKVIRLNYSHTLKGAEMEEWESWKKKYNIGDQK